MNSLITNNETTQREWTARKVIEAKSPYYPLCKSGPLCPLLDDANLLFEFYISSHKRKAIKHFCKSKKWENKPNYLVMTDSTLKLLIRSMCNSPQARRMLIEQGENNALHQAIWHSEKSKNESLFEKVYLYCYDDNGLTFIKPNQLDRLLNEIADGDSLSIRTTLIYLSLAFAMLEDESCAEIVAQIANRYPETLGALGLINESGKQLKYSPEPSLTTESSQSLAVIEPPIKSEQSEEANIQKNNIKCWISSTKQIHAEAERFRRSLEILAKDTRELNEMRFLHDFAENGKAISLLISLESNRKEISKQGSDLLDLFGKNCQDFSGSGCELQKLFQKIITTPTATIDKLLIRFSEIDEAYKRVISNSQAATIELNELKEEEARLRRTIELPAEVLSTSQVVNLPCWIFESITSQKKNNEELKLILSSLIKEGTAKLLARCDQLSAKHNATLKSGSDGSPSEIEILRNKICSIKEISQIQLRHTELDELEEKYQRTERESIKVLAQRLQNSPDSIVDFIDISRNLIDEAQPELAFLLINLILHRRAIEDTTEINDDLLSNLLESATKVAAGDFGYSAVLDTLFLNPMVLGIGRDDIASSDILERLILTLLGGIFFGQADKAVPVLQNFGAAEACRGLPTILQDLITAVLTHGQFTIVSTESLSIKREQENNINERLAFENKKYRHLQCGTAVHFSRFESIQVFPALEKFWSDISCKLNNSEYYSAHIQVNNIDIYDWYQRLVKQHDRPVDEHPHFPVKIRTFMQEVVTLVRDHILFCESIQPTGSLLLAQDEINMALINWAGTQEKRGELIRLFIDIPSLSIGRSVSHISFWSAIGRCRPVLLRCPSISAWLRRQVNPEFNLELEQLILGDLVNEFEFDRVSSILQADSAWEQLMILHRGDDSSNNQDWQARHQIESADLMLRESEILAFGDQGLIDDFSVCVEAGRFPAARFVLDKCNAEKKAMRKKGQHKISSFVSEQFDRVNVIKDVAADSNMPEEWQERVCSLAATLERQLRALKRSDEHEDAIESTRDRLIRAVNALGFAVQHGTQVLDEVLYYLQTVHDDAQDRSALGDERDRALEKCPELLKSWSNLAYDALDENDTKRVWTQFIKEFARICNLYRDESDEFKRFASVPSIKFPFVVYQTAFHKPQSEFLKRPLRLYLYQQKEIDIAALQRLEAEITGDSSAAWLHIIFAPQGTEKLRRFFKYDKGFKGFLVVDEKMLYKICLVDKHDVPVRQELHSSVADISSSSPFIAQGYCHQTNNIYVGRKDILEKLLNTPQAMIWGGRRIGKTSVLHALGTSLGHHTRKYNVAYVYVDLQDSGDPDLAIAKKISDIFRLENVNSLTDFEQQITKLRNTGERFAFLIDEVDEYIKKSQKVHGLAFPLATVLRQLVMDDSKKETILVYSGYHQLYHEAKLNKEKRRVGHPFINIAQDVPIRDLTYDDVNELVKTGFEEMLGMSVSPEVPNRISTLASRHPAFVQQFCRCLLEQVSKRRSPGTHVTITKDDVEAVYAADANGEGGEQAFIFYVNETLGYNLSHLGRAIMLSICLIPDKDPNINYNESYFSIHKIRKELHEWCDVLGVEQPLPEHFLQSIELLEMTNMLTQNLKEHGKYRVTYPTYIDILRRLDKLDKADVEHSLREYDAKERNNGVLL